MMNTRSIRLAYASRYGSTQEVAETITATMCEAGLEVDIQPMKEVKSSDIYDAIVLGTAIYNARWHPDVHKFLPLYQEALRQQVEVIFALDLLRTSDPARRNSRCQLNSELAKYPYKK